MPNMNLSYYVIVIQDLSMSMDDKVLRLYTTCMLNEIKNILSTYVVYD
jgi:hypothetical protein